MKCNKGKTEIITREGRSKEREKYWEYLSKVELEAEYNKVQKNATLVGGRLNVIGATSQNIVAGRNAGSDIWKALKGAFYAREEVTIETRLRIYNCVSAAVMFYSLESCHWYICHR